MSGLQPNEDGTVCCICRKPIVPHVDAVHGAFRGKEARHYACTSAGQSKTAKTLFDEFDQKYKEAMGTLDELRVRLKNGEH